MLVRQIRHTAVAVLTVALAAAALPAAAQEWAGRGRLQGEVKNEAGQPIEGVKITLRKGNDRVDAATPGPPALTTNKNGKWSTLGLGGGAWGILLEKEGYIPSEGQVQVNEFGPAKPINIVLKAITQEMRQQAQASAGGAGDEVRTWLAAGNDLLTQKKWAEARAEYQKAVEKLDAEFKPMVLRSIAQTYAQEQQYPQAVETLQAALAIAPQDVDTLKILAQTYYQQKNTEKAIDTIKGALAVTPDDAALNKLMVDLLVDAGREEEAKTYLAKLPQGTTVDPASLLNIGIRQYNDGKIAEALASFDRVIKENPNLGDAYYYHGLAALALDKSDVAKADFQKLLEIDPQNSHAADARDFLKSL